MTGWKNCTLQEPPVVLYKALGNFSKVLYGTTGGNFSARFFRPVMLQSWCQKTAQLLVNTLLSFS